MENTQQINDKRFKLISLTMPSHCFGRQATKPMLMKNHYKRNNEICSEKKTSQLKFVMAFALLIVFFIKVDVKAQCTATSTSTDVSCYGGNDGSITVIVTSGSGPFTYSWSNGVTAVTNPTMWLNNLSAGTYTVTISDGGSCNITASATIIQPSPITVTQSSTNVSCNGGNDGSIGTIVTGGTPGYSYSWNNGAPQPNLSNLTANVYSLTVTDANNCKAISVAIITESPTIFVLSTVDHVIDCNGGSNGSIGVAVIGGTPGYNYSWPDGSTQPIHSNLIAGAYTITVTDANGCIAVTSIVITQPPAITGTYTLIHGACGANLGTANVTASGGTGALTYSWWVNSGILSQTATGLTAGSYTTYVTDANACKVMVVGNVLSTCDQVWPGDADHDLVADNNDILAIGIGYNSTGALRPSATINWNAQGAFDWGTSLSNGRDFSNVDCNGDGVINGNDTTAIIQNYGLTHTYKVKQPIYINGVPDLTFNIPVDTTSSSSNIKVPIMLGSSINPANGIYGLAFSITYDPKIVDTTRLKFSVNNSWMGTYGTNLIYITKNFGSMGRMDIGITRIDHQNVSGLGKIGELDIYMRDDISGKLAGTLYKTLVLQAIQIRAISNDETVVLVNAGKDSVVVEQGITTGIKKYTTNHVEIYPNPATGSFTIDASTADAKQITITNIIGETVWQQNNVAGKIVVNTQALSAGTYYVSIITSQEKIMKQVNIIR